MTNITELAQRMKAAAEKATPGEWWADEVKNEGCYGSGDDCVEGFTSYAIYGSDGQTLFDSLNSDAACISEEYDGEGHVAWDETAQRNAEFIALANPVNVLALVEALEKAQQERDNWRTTFDNERFRADKLKAHIDEMTEERNASINELSRIIQKEVKAKRETEQRIAELESSTVTVKLPQAVSAGGQGYQEQVERILTAAGIKVEAE
ncbi:ead/Ea22-like family protein [Escherichia coli]|uniref:ead/Ea22-like family protein n=1 Tax=Enterobacteriaceae TaxID=543 RepID=UPI002927C5E7|nr:ead/Ea22-like family protein [Escherichia coli]MDV1934546.1 ead/Ea22-like family protein [Escherichia coli]HEB4946336.1 ead/Ea22-like family protein [Klebsiella quasipneumoniae]